jgi:hypothetical protein
MTTVSEAQKSGYRVCSGRIYSVHREKTDSRDVLRKVVQVLDTCRGLPAAYLASVEHKFLSLS